MSRRCGKSGGLIMKAKDKKEMQAALETIKRRRQRDKRMVKEGA
jgi:hypothetical protein